MCAPDQLSFVPQRPQRGSRRARGQLWTRADGGRDLGVLCLAAVLGGLAQSLAGTAGALLIRRLTGSDALAGLPQSLLVIGYAAAAIGMSRLTPRVGRSAALAIGMATAAAGGGMVAAGAATSRVSLVLIGSGLLGAGNASVMLGRYAAAELVAEAQRARAIGRLLAATTIGAVAGPNLLSPTATLATRLHLPALSGPYLIAGSAFAVAAAVLGLSAKRARCRTAAALPAARARFQAVHRGAIAVLAVANLVMVAVMTMAPLQLNRDGSSLAIIGVVVSMHIAGMYAPSPASAWITARIGAVRAALSATSLLTLACLSAALAANQQTPLAIAMAAVGVGWNLALISGSLLLTNGLPAADRPRREGWGEASMGLAAAGGGSASGLIMTSYGYPTLAAAAALTTALLLPLIVRPLTLR